MSEPADPLNQSWWGRRSKWQKIAIVAAGILVSLTVLGGVFGEEPADMPTGAGPTTTQIADGTTSLATEAPNTTAGAPSATVTETQASTSTTEPSTPTTAGRPNYKVLEIEDISFAGTVRISLRVAADVGTNREQLQAIADQIVSEYQATSPFQALNIFFYHYPELSNDIATLGFWEYAPYGDWGRASEVQLGDYSKHESNDRTKEKDWSLLPDDDAIDVYVTYNEKFDELDTDPLSFPSDEDIYFAVAAELGITVDDVDQAMEAILTWMFNGQ